MADGAMIYMPNRVQAKGDVINKALVLVPHQDDELNIAGQIIPTLLEKEVECRICFSTNGDWRPNEGAVRYREAHEAAKCLGIKPNNLIFLGYADSGKGRHMYNSGDFAHASSSGKQHTRTYGPTLSYTRQSTGMEKENTKASLRKDVLHLLAEYQPDVIFCIDYDSHPDHRALSLVFEEAIGVLLGKMPSYRPLILKKFAYASCWHGPNDYYTFNETLNTRGTNSSQLPFELDNPTYKWSDRIRLRPHPDTITPSFCDNALYKAASQYRSQAAWPNMLRVCNSDVVYWVRRTDCLTYAAELLATSGSVCDLYDFKRFDSNDISKTNDIAQFSGYGWRCCSSDREKSLTIRFETETLVKEIDLFELIDHDNHILKCSLSFDDRTVITVNEIERLGGLTRIVLDSQISCRNIKLTILENEGNSPGLISIEAYTTTMEEYEPLRVFVDLIGSPRQSTPNRVNAAHQISFWVLRARSYLAKQLMRKSRPLKKGLWNLKGRLRG